MFNVDRCDISFAAPLAAAERVVSQRRHGRAIAPGCNQKGPASNQRQGAAYRGEDPAFDASPRVSGRRVSINKPGEVLRKASGTVAHEGAQFGLDSLEYHSPRWIASGCPDDRADLPTIKKLEVTPTSGSLDPDNHFRIDQGHFSEVTPRAACRLSTKPQRSTSLTLSADGEVAKNQPGAGDTVHYSTSKFRCRSRSSRPRELPGKTNR